MPVRLISRLSFLLIVSSLLWAACRDTNKEESAGSAPEIHQQAGLPSLLLQDAGGKKLDLRQYQGKTVFLNFWATWCPPCRAEMPTIQALYEKTKGAPVQFLMVALDDDFNKSLQYARAEGYSFPVLHPTSGLPYPFNVESIPTTFIFNARGELMKRIDGSTDYNSPEFERLLTQ